MKISAERIVEFLDLVSGKGAIEEAVLHSQDGKISTEATSMEQDVLVSAEMDTGAEETATMGIDRVSKLCTLVKAFLPEDVVLAITDYDIELYKKKLAEGKAEATFAISELDGPDFTSDDIEQNVTFSSQIENPLKMVEEVLHKNRHIKPEKARIITKGRDIEIHSTETGIKTIARGKIDRELEVDYVYSTRLFSVLEQKPSGADVDITLSEDGVIRYDIDHGSVRANYYVSPEAPEEG